MADPIQSAAVVPSVAALASHTTTMVSTQQAATIDSDDGHERDSTLESATA